MALNLYRERIKEIKFTKTDMIEKGMKILQQIKEFQETSIFEVPSIENFKQALYENKLVYSNEKSKFIKLKKWIEDLVILRINSKIFKILSFESF